MDIEPNVTPVGTGSGVRDAAQAIEGLGLLEPSTEGLPEQAETSKVTQEMSEVDSGITEPMLEADSTESTTSETEAEGPEPEGEELPDTLDGIADAVGLSPEEFAAHLSVPITVNGETTAVTLAEAQRGYQRQADYDRGMTVLREQRQTFEGQTQAALTEWQTRFQSQGDLTAQLEQAVGNAQVDLDRILLEEGSEAFLAAKLKVEGQEKLLAHAKAEQEKAATQQTEMRDGQMAAYSQEQRRLLVQEIPDFGNEAKGAKLKSRISSYLAKSGFTAQEVGGIVDHRLLVQAQKAMLYDDLQRAKSGTLKKVKGLPKVQKPGAKPDKGDATREKTAVSLNRLRKSGRRADAASHIEDILNSR